MIKYDTESPVERASDGLLTKRELAIRLKVSVRTLDEWMRRGRIAYMKIGKTCRYRYADVLKKLEVFKVN